MINKKVGVDCGKNELRKKKIWGSQRRAQRVTGTQKSSLWAVQKLSGLRF